MWKIIEEKSNNKCAKSKQFQKIAKKNNNPEVDKIEKADHQIQQYQKSTVIIKLYPICYHVVVCLLKVGHVLLFW